MYVGTLDSRLDVPGIVDLATRCPELQVVLLGPLPDPAYVADLRPIRNVHLHPSVARAELVATLRNADLCLLAHRRTPLTEAMSPLKIYEYLAAGMPVIATDLPPVRGIDERVLLADTVGEFADVVPMALALDRADERRSDGVHRGELVGGATRAGLRPRAIVIGAPRPSRTGRTA